MNRENIISATEKFAKKKLGKEGTGHDFWHIKRVLNNARLINKTEKADWFVIYLAVMLHDVGDWKVIGKQDDDYSIAENFLIKQKVGEEIVEKVMFIIKNMSFGKSLNKKHALASKEFYVVQDADRLDAMGAVGIARVFTYGGSKSRSIYNPLITAKKINNTDDYKNRTTSSFHHFEEKLLLLMDLMNTKSAKKIALGRHKYMQSYMKQFLSEWDGSR